MDSRSARLNVNASPTALIAVAKNAARHLIEANQHYVGERYPSAVCSAVFAIEETGKFSILSSGKPLPKSNKRHAVHAFMFYGISRVLEDWQWSMEWQPILRKGWTSDVVLTERQQKMIAEHPEFADVVRRFQAGEISTPEERVQAFAAASLAKDNRDGTSARWKPVVEQGLNQLRIRATYVDVTETGVTGPNITSTEADGICWIALALLTLALMTAVNVGPLQDHRAEVAKELAPVFTDDVELIGQADIAKVIAWLQGGGKSAEAPK
jgi:hypothetical protein